MVDIIQQKLLELEQQENIKILYACESGSRAWGFASPDSDFDVRFIYARTTNSYLSIRELPDVVGLPVDEVLDFAGWDIKKALKLFLKSNAPLYEWLQSPIIYKEETEFAQTMRGLMPAYFSARASASHYLSMAHNTLRDDLQAEEVKLKRYFYALRPALACLWITQKQTVPPMEFDPLRVLIDDKDVQVAINDLLSIKEKAVEKAFIKPVAVLNTWLENNLAKCKDSIPQLTATTGNIEGLNAIFRQVI